MVWMRSLMVSSLVALSYVHRRGDLAAIVQQAGQPQFLAVGVGHAEAGHRAGLGVVHRLGQHHRQLRHELAVAPGVRRLFVDADVDQVDQRLEQFLELADQALVRQRHGRLRGQRLDETLVGRREGADGAGLGVDGVDQLQHTDQLAFVVAHRHR